MDNTILQGRQALILWILPAAFAAIGLFAGLAAWRIRRRRSNRLQLRLLAGRRRLLGEEIDSRNERLAEFDAQELATHRHAANGILDGIHMVLLDREAHLQNLQELAALQSHKLAVLQRRYEELPSLPSEDPYPTAEKNASKSGPILENREALEDQFLDIIRQRDETPKPRPRRRRT